MEITHRRRFRTVLVISCLALGVGFASIAYSVAERRSQAEAAAREAEQDRRVICQAGNRSNQAIVDILNLARSLNGQHPITRAQCQPRPPEGEEFYCRALALLKPIPCG